MFNICHSGCDALMFSLILRLQCSNLNEKRGTTLEPDGEMLETELYKHCQIHLAYTGKHQYATLHRKPFSATNAPPSLRSMLEPMKLRKTTKRFCQQEALDLSLHKSAESSYEVE